MTIRKYIKHRLALLAYFALSALLAEALWLLSGGEPVMAAYCLLLMSAALVFVCLFDYIPLKRRYDELEDILRNLTVFEQSIPESGDVIESVYRDIALGLRERMLDENERMERKRNDSLEYYTMWVHQIKTPICALRLLTEECGASSASKRQIEQELFKVERYAELALQYVKADDISQDLRFSRCNVRRVARECVKKYSPLFIGKGLGVELEEFELSVVTDEKWLAFMIEQVLSNAVKYTSEGGVRIYADGDTLVISDTGRGVAADDAAMIFEKGYTGLNGRLDKRATGIGLYLTKKAADALGIELSLTSRVGEGTRVLFGFTRTEQIYE